MKSSLSKYQAQNPSTEAELLRMNKNLIIDQGKMIVDLTDVYDAHVIEWMKQYSIKKFGVVPHFKNKPLRG